MKKQQVEKLFQPLRNEIKHGRQSMSNMWFFLCSSFLFSLLMVGISFYWAWQSPYWSQLQWLFKVELILFFIHIFVILISLIKHNVTHIVLSISTVFFGYKMIFDPFIFLFLMYVGYEVYHQFALLTYILVGVGIMLHLVLIRKEFVEIYRSKRENKGEVNVKKRLSILSIGFIFVVSSFTAYAIQNQIFNHIEVLIFLFAAFAIFYGVLIGLVDYIIATYCIIRFPSFRIQAKGK